MASLVCLKLAYDASMTTSHHIRTLGVLGGMGPLATLDFMHKVIALTPAIDDQHHIPMIVHSVPQIPDRTEAIMSGNDAPFLPLLAGLRQLERCGVEAILMPCNTAHFWHERLARSTPVPILHIVDAVLLELNRLSQDPAGCMLLSTRGTRQANVYQRVAQRSGSDFQLPDETEQERVDAMIALVKEGKTALAQEIGDSLVTKLRQKGVQRMVLACTELPVALAPSDCRDHFIDATLALAQTAVQFAFQRKIDLAA